MIPNPFEPDPFPPAPVPPFDTDWDDEGDE